MTYGLTTFASRIKRRKSGKGEELAMRYRKALFFLALVASLAVLVEGGAMAADLSMSCGVDSPWPYGTQGRFSVEATGPVYTNDTTSMTYTMTQLTAKQADHMFLTVTAGSSPMVEAVTGYQVNSACDGDELGVGEKICTDQVIRVNTAPSQTIVKITLDGYWKPVPQSFAVRDNNSYWACAIAGLGAEASDACVNSCGDFFNRQGVTTDETITWGDTGCIFVKKRHPVTGAFLGVKVVSGPCHVVVGEYGEDGPQPASGFFFDGESVLFGDDADIVSGSNTCYWCVVNQKLSKLCTN